MFERTENGIQKCEQSDDAELLRQFHQERSEAAFGELVARHVDLVYSVALRQVIFDEHLAKDVVQEVFIALARKAGSLKERSTIGGWLYRSARFAARDAVRAESRRRAREASCQIMNEAQEQAAPEPDWERIRPVLDEAISELGAADRDAIWLRYFEKRSYAEIGARLRLNENAARMRVNRALQRLNKSLSKRGVRSSSAAIAAGIAGQAGIAAPSLLATSVTQAAVGAVASSVAGVSMLTALGIMNTTKGTTILVAAVMASAAGVAWRASEAAAQTRDELEQARLRLSRAQIEVQSAEIRHQALLAGAVASGAELQSLREAVAKQIASASVAVLDEQEPLTVDYVKARFENAQELDDSGKLEEALAEYLWCYDEGMIGFAHFDGVRNSSLLNRIAGLAKRCPPAEEALRLRRAEAERKLLADDPGEKTVADLIAIDRVFGEIDRSVGLYDQLPKDDERGNRLSIYLFETFLERGRYEDAIRGRPFRLMRMTAEMLLNQVHQANSEVARERAHERALELVGCSIEALAGAGELENALELAARILDYDASAETVAALKSRFDRFGQGELMTILAQP